MHCICSCWPKLRGLLFYMTITASIMLVLYTDFSLELKFA